MNLSARHGWRGTVGVAAAAGMLTGVGSAAALPSQIDPGFTSWYQAAQTGRADVLILGDSVTLFRGHGWDAGITSALADRVGLAGTGLLYGRSQSQGDGYESGGTWNAAWTPNGHDPSLNSAAPLPTLSANATPASLWVGVAPGSAIDLTAGSTLDVWAITDPGTPAPLVDRRLAQPPYTVGQAAQAVPLPTANQPTPTSIAINPTNDPSSEIRLRNVTHTDVFGFRARTPNPGVTVTSFGLGGRTALTHHDQFYQPLNADARTRLYDMLTHGSDSGKLVVFPLFGFNDINETAPSQSLGLTDADSPEAFIDNMRFYIDALALAWTDAGRDADDLSFVVSGMYPQQFEPDTLRDYAAELLQLAIDHPQVSFVDPWAQRTLTENLPNLFDGLHPSQVGSYAMSEELIAALVATPLPGDFNGDGTIEQRDLDLVLGQWGTDPRVTGGLAQFGSLAGWSGVIDQAELDTVLAGWGSSATPDLRGFAVPEPAATLALALLALLTPHRATCHRQREA